MEILIAEFFQFSIKIKLSKVLFSAASWDWGHYRVFSEFTKLPVAIVSEVGDKSFFAYHVITRSMSYVTQWVRYPYPKSQVRVIATEPSNKNIYVLQIGANFY